MTLRSHLARIVCAVLLAGLAGPGVLRAQVTFYSGATAHSDWLTAAGGTPTVLDFESISSGTEANNAGFVTYAATAGVVFQPLGNSSYPRVEIGQGGNGAVGANWLGNFLDQGFTSANAIAWTFNESIRAFGFYDVGSDDGFIVTVYSTNLTSLGSFNTAEQLNNPLFWGFIANQDIGKVEVMPRSGFGNGYIGIDGLSTIAIPEPGATVVLLGAAAGLVACAWRRRRQLA